MLLRRTLRPQPRKPSRMAAVTECQWSWRYCRPNSAQSGAYPQTPSPSPRAKPIRSDSDECLWTVPSSMPRIDLEPIRLNYLNEKLCLDMAETERNSPARHLPATAGELVV